MRPSDVLLAREADRDALRRAGAVGSVHRVRRGAYLRERPPDPEAAALARIAAVHRQLAAGHWFSHLSAAVLWGCRTWAAPERVHVVQGYRASSRSAGDVARHAVDLPAGQRTTVDGMPVTTLERTVLDCALSLHPLHALVVADSALGRGLNRAAALDLWARSRARRGRRRAELVLRLADPGAESPWETWARYVLVRAGLPRPVLQVPVVTRLGTFRCDLGWPEHGVLVEFDGAVKYRPGVLRPEHDGAAELWREKRRFDAIRETGANPVRLTAADARDVGAAVARVAARFPPGVREAMRVDPLMPLP
ncbi:type IV toxin-antitoxin system AbiEi family antitoxin domain-containing protein [Puerhibacterium puerhi]|uniref:type IV toxin-antitoxin system AbiEi family antitoxin domain-containing protein n=1 Tax=Puerhibacterium puerhi TaxID=2692623 RepID=UPI00135AC2C8|nr:hypothetical protein [Puerhibacterium puerhi]